MDLSLTSDTERENLSVSLFSTAQEVPVSRDSELDDRRNRFLHGNSACT
jgi:hypothetical protein